ncbi:MAG: hypothetical protein ABJB86_05750 [Bacteroidota bacterium]
MAKPSIDLVLALRETSRRLQHGVHYVWGHHGACNCGNLLQVITRLDEKEILIHAHTGIGEWTEISDESCAVSGAPVSLLLSKLEAAGLTPTDIHNIEYLDNKEVLKYLPGGFRWLKRNNRQHVIEYFEAFADMLEEKLLIEINIPTQLIALESAVSWGLC